MKDLKTSILESKDRSLDSLWLVQGTVKSQEKKKIQTAIYKQLEKTGTTGRFYTNDPKNSRFNGYWSGVNLVKQDIEDAFKKIKNPQHKYEVSIAPDNGGYRKSKDGLSQWKQYKVEIFVKGINEPILMGTLNCHAAGTVEDPFDLYDMSCCIGY